MAKLILTNAIAEDLKTAASDSFIDSLKMIEVDDIQPNKDNFYEMTEIEELAEDIERQGLMSVLVATAAENGKYDYPCERRRSAAGNSKEPFPKADTRRNRLCAVRS